MITAAIITGLGLGSMYALLALGFHITYVVSRTVNFAQGSAMMVGAVLGYSFYITWGWPLWLAIPATLTLCAIYGLAIERFLVRPFHSRGSEAWLMATVAAGILVDNLALFTFGKEPRQFTSALANQHLELLGNNVGVLQLLIPLVGGAIALALFLVRRYTRLGKVLEACVQNPRAAMLMGIRVNRVVAVAFAVSTVFAAIAGLLIAPLFSVNAEMGMLFGLKAFAVAILGGIASASGVFAAGLLFGLVEALVTIYFGSAFTQLFTFALVILALALRPNGLFGSKTLVKV
ncbi:branched-chain amino acid ABC transporter permease [Pseudomonas daroniae]|uniref:Branched-chain amino acid ABC transporter permease n=2 Tax=Phytopseudomonas TaxID=3236657 RepID=A0A4Q9QVF3_9GAMM|nr:MULTISPECIES: branched-chain amino acid ABC transporter permease [Pseudomonas]TBU72223.1 branched-chain amino acid ABC transporter permease [Pseudomonas daroniae]TBU75697.1 branched-chain amino acid ABC transporter permease [Pseudomonas daroniae]TBU80492.1 branched-chain amino acid ABC transporter permease [Pseudomonas sp. FRB 228]TBU86596.1 branched-chain amino acid ABC transporter permease [Pseudomonas dryadis]TBU89683.1 branched-chain amino acid ABC transporter permease [Pseudomonas daro